MFLLSLSACAGAAEDSAWFPFNPKPDPFADSPIDLRFLNERFAGEHGFIAAKDGHFIHSANGQPVRFWAVNGPPGENGDRAALRQTARLLAKYGVNLASRVSSRPPTGPPPAPKSSARWKSSVTPRAIS